MRKATHFSKLLADAMQARGITDAQLSKVSGISIDMIDEWKRGTSAPDRRDDLERLADALDVYSAEVQIWTISGLTLVEKQDLIGYLRKTVRGEDADT